MLKTLQHIIQEIANAQNFKEALSILVKQVAKALETDACSVFLMDKNRGEYVLVATQGLNKDSVGKARIPLHQGLIGLVGQREESINIDDASHHPHFLSLPELNEESYKAFLGTPIIYHRQVLGVLVAQQHESRRYDENEEAFLVTLATQLASIVAHADTTGAIAKLFKSHQRTQGEAIYSGIPGSPGVGIGSSVTVHPFLDLETIPNRHPDDVEAEIRLLEDALACGREDFKALSERLYPSLPIEERALLDVYQRLLDTSDLGVEIIHAIRRGNWAQGALREVIQSYVDRLQHSENHYLRERANDIRDLGHRILGYLQKNDRPTPLYADKTILIGEQLTVADLAEVPEGCLVGVISMKGSRSSHVAILARAMGIPAVMGIGDIPLTFLQEKNIIVDGYYGQVYVEPHTKILREFERLAEEEQELNASLESLRDIPAETKDGYRVTLFVNTGLGADVSLALAAGAEGVGLYRTEMPFSVRDRFPSSEEQRVIYRQLLASFSPRPVIMRTLDIGGDKSLSYFPVKEDNPFLGWRGIRITLDHPDIFLTQARAMMRANNGYGNLKIMLPMITDIAEVDEALRLLKKAYTEVKTDIESIEMPQVGVMIEVPSAVYQARSIAKRVDFLSVGTNDLTQYLLAVDRNNAQVAHLYDSLHPAVLKALLHVVEAGHQEGKHVSICGEMASDAIAIPLLLAMGFDSLSMSSSSLLRMKWVVREFSLKDAKQLLQEVLNMESAVMIRCHLELVLGKLGLGGLIRAGKK